MMSGAKSVLPRKSRGILIPNSWLFHVLEGRLEVQARRPDGAERAHLLALKPFNLRCAAPLFGFSSPPRAFTATASNAPRGDTRLISRFIPRLPQVSQPRVPDGVPGRR